MADPVQPFGTAGSHRSSVRGAREPRQGRRLRGARTGRGDGRAPRVRGSTTPSTRSDGGSTATATAACSTSDTATRGGQRGGSRRNGPPRRRQPPPGLRMAGASWPLASPPRTGDTLPRGGVRRRRRRGGGPGAQGGPSTHRPKSGIVSARGGYHGHTGLAMATGDPEYRDPFGANPAGFDAGAPSETSSALGHRSTTDTAAVILETIPATLGMPLPPPGYLA